MTRAVKPALNGLFRGNITAKRVLGSRVALVAEDTGSPVSFVALSVLMAAIGRRAVLDGVPGEPAGCLGELPVPT